MNSIFIATKPLQYINCTNIAKDPMDSICCICDQFADSFIFYDYCIHEGLFGGFKYFKTKEHALLYWLWHQNRIKALYLDSDFGLFTRFLLLLYIGVRVFVYEEGYASYQPLRIPNTIKDKAFLIIQKLLGIKNFNGGSCKVKGVFLYNKEKYDKAFPGHNKTIMTFESPFYDAVGRSMVLLKLSDKIDWDLFEEKKVLIYLSSWNISKKAIDYCRNRDDIDIRVLKLHPNIKDMPADLKDSFDYVLPSSIMFEFFYAKVRESVESMIIVHHNTFAVEYIDEKDKVNSVII